MFQDRECCVCKKVRYNVSIPCEHPICILCVIDYRGGKCPVCKESIPSLLDDNKDPKFWKNYEIFLIFLVIGIVIAYWQPSFESVCEWGYAILKLLHAFSH